MSKKRILLVIVFLVLAITGTVAYVTAGKTEKVQPYRFASVERGEIVAVVSSTGTLNAVTTVDVGTQVSGTIAALYADFNSHVSAGQVIALIDTTFLHASVVDAQASLERVHANVQAARIKLDRVKALFSRNLSTQAEYDDAQTNLIVAIAQEKQQQASLDRTQINLRYATIRAPIDGVVINRAVDVGQTVAASLSAPTIFTIANDLAQMELQLSVDEADVGLVKEDQRVTFKVEAYPDQQFEGRVYQVRLFPQTVQNVVTYKVIVRVDNTDLKLRPGMTATATIVVGQREDAVKVPLQATRFIPPPEQLAAIRAEMMRGAGGSPDSSRSLWTRLASLVMGRAASDTAQSQVRGPGSRGSGGGGWGSSGGSGSTGWGANSGGWGSGGWGSGSAGGWGSGARVPATGSGVGAGTGGWGSGGSPRAGGPALDRVWVQTREGKLRSVPVQLGIQDRQFAELIGGDLQEGQQVIVAAMGSSKGPSAPQNQSPFGGGGRGGFGGGGGGLGGGRR